MGLTSAPIELWLAAIATMSGLFGAVMIVITHRRSKNRWQRLRPHTPVLDARLATLQASRSERFVAPLFDAVAARAQQVLRPSSLEDAEALLEKAGPLRFLNPRRLVLVKLLMIPLGIAVALIGTRTSSGDTRMFALAGVPLVAWQLPRMYLRRKIEARSDEITRQLPDVLDQITISVGAGLGLEAAMQRVSQRTDTALSAELTRTLQDIRIGVDRVVAYRGLARRSSSQDLAGVVSSLVQCLEMGTPLTPVLRARATELRRKRRADAEERAQKLSVKLAVPTALCILPSLMMVVMGPTIVTALESGLGG